MKATDGSPGLDPTTPNVARRYDYYLGGKGNFESDRVAAEKVAAYPRTSAPHQPPVSAVSLS